MVVDRGIQREGTGFFDALEDSLLVEIISQLSLKDRLSAATVVCKSWRFLRDQALLWTSLELCDPRAVHDYRCGDNVWQVDSSLRIIGSQAGALLDFVTATRVTSLSLHSGDGSRFDNKAVEKLLAALPSLTSLTLCGKSIKSSVLQALARLPSTAHISRFELGEPVFGSQKEVLALLTKMPLLERLVLPSKLIDEAQLLKACESWKATRSGPPLLSALRVRGLNDDVILLTQIPALARWLPELEELELPMNGYGRHVETQWATLEAVPRFPQGVALGRLHTLRLGHGCTYDTCLTTQQVGALLASVLRATPVLARLMLLVGEPYARNKPSKPGLDGGLAHLPPTIVTVEVSDVCVGNDELDGCVALPALSTLTLHNVDGDVVGLCNKARLNCSALRHTCVTDWKHGRRPYKDKLAAAQPQASGGSDGSSA